MNPDNPVEDENGNETGATPEGEDQSFDEELDKAAEERRRRRRARWRDEQAESDIEIFALSKLEERLEGVHALPKDDQLVVFIHDACRKVVAEHVAERDTELGGLLIGRVFGSVGEDGSSTRVGAVEICKAVRSQDYETTHISLAMDASVWTLARASLDEGEVIVGWYHSHPDLGAFFSGTDQQTQRTIFPHDYSVALVSDPVRDEEKWFASGDALEIDPERIIYV